MAYWVFIHPNTGHVCGMLDPASDALPGYIRTQRDDLHTYYGDLADILKVENGQIVNKTDSDLLSLRQSHSYARLARDFANYVSVARGYNADWKQAASECREMAKDALENPAITAEQKSAAKIVKSKVKAVRDWIYGPGGINDYFAAKAHEIYGSSDPLSVKWDFSTFDPGDPGVTLVIDIYPQLVILRNAVG